MGIPLFLFWVLETTNLSFYCVSFVEVRKVPCFWDFFERYFFCKGNILHWELGGYGVVERN